MLNLRWNTVLLTTCWYMYTQINRTCTTIIHKPSSQSKDTLQDRSQAAGIKAQHKQGIKVQSMGWAKTSEQKHRAFKQPCNCQLFMYTVYNLKHIFIPFAIQYWVFVTGIWLINVGFYALCVYLNTYIKMTYAHVHASMKHKSSSNYGLMGQIPGQWSNNSEWYTMSTKSIHGNNISQIVIGPKLYSLF